MLLIRQAKLVNGSVRDLLIENDRVTAVEEQITVPQGAEILEAEGKTLLPAFVDMHVHLRDPGQTHKEDILTGAAAAAAGGFFAVAAMPNTNPVCDSVETLQYILEKAKEAPVQILPVAAVTKGLAGQQLCDLEALAAAGACAFSDDGKPVATAELLTEALERCAAMGKPLLAHCEDLDIVNGGIIHKGKVSEALGVPGIDRASEDVSTAREIESARKTGTPVHICHVSTRGSLEIIRRAKAEGVAVTAESGPHYFTFTDDKLLMRDADYRMNPPLREQEDVDAVIAAFCDGTLDAIATDHAPHAPQEKADFCKAPNGVTGLETSFAASYTALVRTGLLSLQDLCRLMSTFPAEKLGLEAPRTEVGGRACFALCDLEKSFVVDPAQHHSRSRNSVFKGKFLYGSVEATIKDGKIIYKR